MHVYLRFLLLALDIFLWLGGFAAPLFLNSPWLARHWNCFWLRVRGNLRLNIESPRCALSFAVDGFCLWNTRFSCFGVDSFPQRLFWVFFELSREGILLSVFEGRQVLGHIFVIFVWVDIARRILLFNDFSAALLYEIRSKNRYLCYNLGASTKIGGVARLEGVFLGIFAFEELFGADLFLIFSDSPGRRRRELLIRLNLFKIMRNFKSRNFHTHFLVSLHVERVRAEVVFNLLWFLILL